MRKWLMFIVAGSLFVFPAFAAAQGGVTLSTLRVQLLPEYDQASMLVIYDFDLANTTDVPANITIKIPAQARLFAVAYNNNGDLFDASTSEPVLQGDWQVITIKTGGEAAYRLEYYEPLSMVDVKRQFTYLWPGDYAVKNFSIFLGKPVDATRISIDPEMDATQRDDGLPGFGKNFGSLSAGQQLTLTLQYEKATDTLVQSPDALQPSSPINENTPGRISPRQYLPYFLGGLGLALIFGGFVYYWRANRKPVTRARRRQRTSYDQEESDGEVYCHQCGTRARPGDRFCRVCGSRLRQDG